MFLLNIKIYLSYNYLYHIDLQYKMFLLNNKWARAKAGIWQGFTIQNVPIKSYPPQTTYIVYHFS